MRLVTYCDDYTWMAYDDDTYDGCGSVLGMGPTKQAAIADFREQWREKKGEDPMSDKTIDERLDAIAQSVELIAGMQEVNEHNIKMLTQTVSTHEKERERFARAVRAALEAWFGEEDGSNGHS